MPINWFPSITQNINWGNIQGSILSQSDLSDVLQTKANLEHSHNNYVNINSLINGYSLENNITLSKSDIGLENIENYSIANQAEAELGTNDDKYMTPERTKQAILANSSSNETLLFLNELFTINSTTEQNINDFDTTIRGDKKYIIKGALSFGKIQPGYFYVDIPSGCTGFATGYYFDNNTASGYTYKFGNQIVLSSHTRIYFSFNRNYTSPDYLWSYAFFDIVLFTSQNGSLSFKTKISTAGNIAEILKGSYISLKEF